MNFFPNFKNETIFGNQILSKFSVNLKLELTFAKYRLIKNLRNVSNNKDMNNANDIILINN